MGIKKVVLSIFILFFISNLLTIIWYMVTDEMNWVSFRREEPIYLGLTLNHLLFVLGFIYLFPTYIKEQNTRFRALVYGVVLAIIMFVPTGIVVRSIWKVDFNLIFILNTAAHGVIGGILGLIMRYLYNYKK